jgi:hypothetical protein
MQVNRSKIQLIVSIFALFFLTTSCVEEYWPELDSNSDKIVVVDGKITNFPGPYTVKLSYSSSIDSSYYKPIPSAEVIIIDDQGNREILTENDSGIYLTKIGGLQGVVGNSYKIKITLSNGNIYESEFEELQDPVEVENVYVEESWQLADNSLEEDIEGYQFYVNSKQSSSSKTYFYWEIEETFEYHSDYNIVFLYDGKRYDTTGYNILGLAQTINQDTLFYCWKTQTVPERFYYSTEYLSSPIVNNLPLHFIPFADERLKQKYSILVKQYTISESTYTFLDKLQQQNESQEALFTTQPFQIRGNISNVNNPSEAVLGYFMVASGTYGPRLLTKPPSRIFYDNTKCRADTSLPAIQNFIQISSAPDLPVYFTFVYFPNPDDPMAEALEVLALVSQDCLDCTTKGGVATKPEYWDW